MSHTSPPVYHSLLIYAFSSIQIESAALMLGQRTMYPVQWYNRVLELYIRAQVFGPYIAGIDFRRQNLT